MTLTKAKLEKQLRASIGLTNKEAKEIVELFFKSIEGALAKAEEVKLSGFGNFILHDKRSRPGRNLRTGEVVYITARRVVTFRSGQKLRARIERYQHEVAHYRDDGHYQDQ